MFERFSDRARRVLVLAQEEARQLGHGFIGTEHLLLALTREKDGLAAIVLRSFDVTYERTHAVVVGLTDASHPNDPQASPPFTPRSKRTLELALREALQLEHNYVGTEHLLLGLIREHEGVASSVFAALGVDAVAVRQRTIETITTSPSGEGASGRPAPGPGRERPLNPTSVVAGPRARISVDGSEFRVVGILCFTDGVRVIWRIANSEAPSGSRLDPDPPTAAGPPPVGAPDLVAIGDDAGTAYEHRRTGVEVQSNGERAGTSLFTPAVPVEATGLEIIWRQHRLAVELDADR